MRRDRGRLGVAVADPLDPGAGSAAGAARRPDALSDGRRGAGAGVPGGRRRGSRDPAPRHLQDRRGAADAGGDEAAADPCRGDRGDPGFDLHPELRGRPAAPGGPDRQCRDDDRTAAGLRRRRQGRDGPRSTDPPRPRGRRTHRGHDAGVDGLPILDWFHLAMRLRHLTQVAGGLSSEGPERAAAKAVVVEEVERLHWRLWNGRAKDAKVSVDRIRAVLHHFRDERGGRGSVAPSRKLWTALRALDGYLVGQSDRLVDYGKRHRAGLRVGTALTEGTANFLVNRRMNKSQQMRWARRGADRLLQVRCAVYNGTLGTGFGQRFYAANDALPPVAAAA